MKYFLEKLLGNVVFEALENKYMFSKIFEIRIRNNKPIIVNYNGDYQVLFDKNKQPLFANKNLIQQIILIATEHSLYAYNDQLKEGFITASGGIRIGVSGEVVYNENNEITTIRNFTGLTIRIPHAVSGCADIAMKYIKPIGEPVKNVMLVSKPGCGKTTILRDVAKGLSDYCGVHNVLVVDERYEIANCVNGVPQFDIGKYTDVISGANKLYAFREGVRSMRPNVIICDELMNERDCEAVEQACNSGVRVISSIHANSKEDLLNKKYVSRLLFSGVIDYYIFLNDEHGVGTYACVYNSKFDCIYCM